MIFFSLVFLLSRRSKAEEIGTAVLDMDKWLEERGDLINDFLVVKDAGGDRVGQLLVTAKGYEVLKAANRKV